MRIHFAGKFRIFAWIFWWSSQHARRYFVLGKFPIRTSIFWGSSQHVHVFFWEVRIPNVHWYFGEITNVYWYLVLLLTWPTPFWGRKTQKVHRFFGNMFMDLQARYLTCAPILRVPQVASIGCIYLWFNKNIILYLQKPNTEQKCQASHPPPRYMLLVRNS